MPRNTGWRLMLTGRLFLGLDLGTSGARAAVIDDGGREAARGAAAMAGNLRDPEVWRQAAQTALQQAFADVDPGRVAAVAVDGTSGTVLAVDAAGTRSRTR